MIANRTFVKRAERAFVLAEADGTLDAYLAKVSRSNLRVLAEAAENVGNLYVYSRCRVALDAKPKLIWNGTDIVEVAK